MTINDPIKTAEPLVSIIIPTYNYGALIGETLSSLQRQTLTDWECVVVDDGSTDDTAGVVARVAGRDPRVRYLRQENQRQSVAKNTGLADARGKYVQFLDADDLIEPLKFERQVEFLEAHAEADIVYGGVRFFRTERPAERLYAMFGENESWMPEVSGASAPPFIFCTSSVMPATPARRASGIKRLSTRYRLSADKIRPERSLRSFCRYS